MPDTSSFKSVSVSVTTHNQLKTLAENRFEVPVSIQKVIDFLLEKELKKKNENKNIRRVHQHFLDFVENYLPTELRQTIYAKLSQGK